MVNQKMDNGSSYEKFWFTPESQDATEMAVTDWIEELEDLPYDKLRDVYSTKYEKRMFCSECYCAPLHMVRSTKNKIFLRTYDKHKHTERCSHRYPKLGKKAVKELITRLSDNDLQKKLEAGISLCTIDKKKKRSVENSENGKIEDNPLLVTVQTNGGYSTKSFPRRSINFIGRVEDDSIMLLYGNVRIEVLEWGENSYLHAKRLKDGHLLLSIKITSKVKRYLREKYDMIDKALNEKVQINVHLAVICSIWRNEKNGRIFYNTTLRGSQYILLKEHKTE